MKFAQPLTVMIPFYNERENLPGVVAETIAFADATLADFELLLIDDGSTDESAAVLPTHPRLRVITHERNRGLTAALRTGFFAAQKDLVTWLPADGQIPLSEIGKMVRAYRGEDLLLTTYSHRPDGVVRKVMSKTVRLLVRAATGFRDRLEGPYLFRRAILPDLALVSTTSAGSIGLELAAKVAAKNYRIGSLEISCVERRSGTSKVANLKNILSYLQEVWRIRDSMKKQGLR